MRAILEAVPEAEVGTTGTIRVELTRAGLPALSDERPYQVIKKPPVRPVPRQATFPPFEVIPVNGTEDERWITLSWPDNINSVASSAVMENGRLVIYYSTVSPKYENQRATLERRDTSLVASFTKRYEIWLAVHSLILYQDQQVALATAGQRQQAEEDPELAEDRERQERCRTALLSVLFAAREV